MNTKDKKLRELIIENTGFLVDGRVFNIPEGTLSTIVAIVRQLIHEAKPEAFEKTSVDVPDTRTWVNLANGRVDEYEQNLLEKIG